ncbi:hypothetical protein [Pseudoalteromonas xiamenensis]|uniref:Uncharacterized protein n=1 Tax=Pseudoalteromonas xiamenensis TaxID=882626 RepID=A0A975DG75_9GAMM|nr:hypothetical protein [Pseudoalteromonas xiamenensis]QTH70984.1 hypothetical protein J5O05_14070 [Pseudoalteromonas xiamenensis]
MYKHTQFGWAIWGLLTWIASFVAIALVLIGPNIGVVGFLVLLLVMAILFGTLTVEVDDQAIRWWFGPGVFKREVKFSEIKTVQPVINSWMHGIGVRITHDGWVYGVHGFRAVELTLLDDTQIRIGTNQQRKLTDLLEAKVAN